MMDPNSTGSGGGSAGSSGKGQQPPPLLTMNLPSSQSPPFAPTLQQQQHLAMQWLEQQQRNSFNPAALLAAVGTQSDQQQLLLQQQQPPPPPPQQQSLLRHNNNNNVSHSISPLTSQSSNPSDLRQQQQQLLEIEIRRQIMLQQQQQQLAAQARDNLNFDQLKALLQERLGSSVRSAFTGIPSNGSQGGARAVPPATISGRGLPVVTSEVDHMMAAETLLQRSMLHDAITTLQLQGGLQQNSSSRIANGNRDTTSFAPSAFLLPNEAITPHNIGQASSLTNTAISQLLQPGILDMRPVVPKVPRIDDQIQSLSSHTKRKSDSTTSRKEEPLPKKLKSNERNMATASSFPLPSTKQTRRLKLSFKSFQDVWDELETTPLQKDIFIRRLNKYDCHLVD